MARAANSARAATLTHNLRKDRPIRLQLTRLVVAASLCCAALSVAPLLGAASDPDPRVLSVKKAFVMPVDELGDDKPIAVCLAKHLADQTPLTIVERKEMPTRF